MIKDLNSNEKIVMDAIIDDSYDENNVYGYATASYVKKNVDMSRYRFAGYISSLQKKGWLFSFPTWGGEDDFDISCEAAEFYGKPPKRFCNSDTCDLCKTEKR